MHINGKSIKSVIEIPEKCYMVTCEEAESEFSVPLSTENAHYHLVQEWVKNGGKIKKADPVEA